MDVFTYYDLSQNEKKVAEVFFQDGILSTGDITKKTGISRPNVYDILNKLIEKGLITRFVENGQVLYSVNTLDFDSLYEKKQKELQELKSSIVQHNVQIKAAQLKRQHQHHVEIFTGKKGLFQFFQQNFKTKNVFVFGAEGVLEEKYPHIWTAWTKYMKEKNISFKVIYTLTKKKFREQNNIPLISARYIDRDIFTNVTTQVMDDQVNLFHWDEIPLVVSIKSKAIADAYLSEFNLMWDSAVK